MSALLLVVALCSKPGAVRAGDLEDCNAALPAKSEPACTAVINESSRSVDDRLKAYVGRARAYLETARLDQALGDLNTAISINPNLPAAFFWRAQVYRRKGDVDHAIEDVTRAIIQAGGIDRASYFARAQLFTAKGDYAHAIADFDKLLSVAPDDKAVQQQRQSAIAMQTELARVHEGQQPAARHKRPAAAEPGRSSTARTSSSTGHPARSRASAHTVTDHGPCGPARGRSSQAAPGWAPAARRPPRCRPRSDYQTVLPCPGNRQA